MCWYCYFKELKSWARLANKKVYITKVETGYKLGLRPRDYRPSVEEDGLYEAQEGTDIIILSEKPERCTESCATTAT